MEKEKECYNTISNPQSTASETESSLPLIDQLITATGYTSIHFKTLFFLACIIFLDGVHMSLLSSTYIPFQNYFGLTDTQISLISSTLFIAFGIGSFLTVFPSLISNRRLAIINFTYLVFFCNLILGLFPTLPIFIIMRMLIGVCLGVILPLINNLLCEVLPIKNRSFSMIAISCCFNLGAIFLNVLLFLITPNFQKEGLFTVYLLLSVPPLMIALIYNFFLEESPRYLILYNKEEKGFQILEKMIGMSLEQEQKDTIENQIKSGANKNIERKLSSIFEGKFRLITILLILIWMFNSYLTYGGSITLSMTLKHIEEMNANKTASHVATNQNESHKDYSSIIKEQIIVYIISSPGAFLAAIMTEIKTLGRKMTTFIGFFFIGISCCLAVLDVNNFSIYFGLSGFFISLSFTAPNSYSSEVYPTKVRDLAVGFLYTSTRVAGFLSQFIAVQLFKIHYLGQVYASILISCLACFSTYMLPYDTHGMALDEEREEGGRKVKIGNVEEITLNNEPSSKVVHIELKEEEIE